MAIRDYKCKACDHKFEDLQLSADIKPQCPECSSLDLEALPTAPGGYRGNFGGSSTRRKGSGSFKRSK